MTLKKATATITDEQDLSTGDINNIKSALGIDTIESEQVTQNESIAANTAKNSYPSEDALKLSTIEAGAEVNTIDSTVTGEPTGSDIVTNIVSLTQSEYDAGTPIAGTFYIITDA